MKRFILALIVMSLMVATGFAANTATYLVTAPTLSQVMPPIIGQPPTAPMPPNAPRHPLPTPGLVSQVMPPIIGQPPTAPMPPNAPRHPLPIPF